MYTPSPTRFETAPRCCEATRRRSWHHRLGLLLLLSFLGSFPVGASPTSPSPAAAGSSRVDATSGRQPILGQDLLLPPAPPVGQLSLGNPEMLGIQRDVRLFFETLSQAQAESGTTTEAQAQAEALNGGPLSEEQLVELEGFRSEVSLFLTAASANPAAGNFAPLRLYLSHEQVLAATPEDLYLLRERILVQVDWSLIASRLASPDLAPLHPLAQHGPLGPDDRVELESFRQDLFDLADAIERLPAETRRGHGIRSIESVSGTVATLPVETLFLLRESMEASGSSLAQARRGVRALDRIETLTDEGAAELEGLRGQLLETLIPTASSAEEADQLASAISQMRVEHLALAEATLAEIPAWERTLPALQSAARSPDLEAELDALGHGDTTLHQELAEFRVEMTTRLDGMELPPEMDRELARQASRFFGEASPEQLAIYRRALAHEGPHPSPTLAASLAVAIRGLDPIDLGRIGRLDLTCGFSLGTPPFQVHFNPCRTVSNAVNSLIINPLNSFLGTIERAINLSIGAINAIEGLINDIGDLLTNLGFDDLINLILETAMEVVQNALGAIGDQVLTIDHVLGQAVLTVREFVDQVKRPFIDLVNSAGDPASESELLTQFDAFVFNRDPNNGPLGLVTCMEEILCVQEETVSFEVILPGQTEPVVRQEQLCRKGFFIPLIGEVGSDRSVFACMVIKNEMAFLKDLMPEDSLPGGKVADVALSTFVHRLDQLCYVNDWMAGNRRLLLDRVETATRNARFHRILGSCTLDGVDLDCPDLPDGASIASVLGGVAAEVGLVRAGVGGVQASVDGVQSSVDSGFDNANQRFNALAAQISSSGMDLGDQLRDFEALDLQMSIEANLATTAQFDDMTSAVSLFVLPEAVGGMLEVSEDLVISIIHRAQMAGLPVGDARALLATAQEAIARNEFRRGYLNLARAYDAVLRLSPLEP